MEHLGKHPFDYKLDQIRSYILGLLEFGELEEAISSIRYIRSQYLKGRINMEINHSRSPFYHLEDLHMQDTGHAFNGSKYPDGSIYGFIYELNKLSDLVKNYSSQNLKDADTEKLPLEHLSVIQVGYILYFLMTVSYKDFVLKRDTEKIKEYLKEIGYRQTAFNTAWDRGVAKIRNMEKNRDKIKKEDFAVALITLEKIDTKAFKMATQLYEDYFIKENDDYGLS